MCRSIKSKLRKLKFRKPRLALRLLAFKLLTFNLLTTALLSGCSQQAILETKPEDLSATSQVWHWQLEGKLALKQGNTSQTANLSWQQKGAEYAIKIFGPLGQGGAELKGEPFYVRLTTSKGELIEAASPENLSSTHLEWQLPLSNLVYWVRGQAAPGRFQQLDANTIYQEGWKVSWRRFTQVEGYALPSLLVINKADLNLRLALNKWQLSN